MKDAKFKKLEVWQEAIQLACETFKIIESLKEEKDYALSSQIWRSCVSISSNIAEGVNAGSDKNYIQYLNIANGSLSEFRSKLALCEALQLKSLEDYDLHQLDHQADIIGFKLYRLMMYLKRELAKS